MLTNTQTINTILFKKEEVDVKIKNDLILNKVNENLSHKASSDADSEDNDDYSKSSEDLSDKMVFQGSQHNQNIKG